MAHRTHIEDLKESIQVRFPTRDHFLVISRTKHPSNSVSLASLDDLLLYFRDRPKSGMWRGSECALLVQLTLLADSLRRAQTR